MRRDKRGRGLRQGYAIKQQELSRENMMNQDQIESAAKALVARRQNGELTGRLSPQQRPDSAASAFALQQAVVAKMSDSVAGWKCALPISDGPVVAPIFAGTLYQGERCPIIEDNGSCKIEPEIAFRFGKDLPPRQQPYSEAEVRDALAGASLALELIINRYLPDEEASFLEHLADCLFNQGLYIGPSIELDDAFAASEMELNLSGPGIEPQTFAGKHPNGLPQTPLYWLVNFLSEQGVGIKAGQQVITSSYAGVIEVEPGQPFKLQIGDLGSIETTLELA